MLARFFGRQPDATEAIRSVYPEEVWSYLNSATPSQSNGETRREQLVAKWRREGRIEQDASPKGQRRIESITGNISQAGRLDINELNDRIAMLLDARNGLAHEARAGRHPTCVEREAMRRPATLASHLR